VLEDKHWSEGVARQAVWLGGQAAFASVAEIMWEIGKVSISDSSVWRLAQKWGERFQAAEKARVMEAEGVFPTAKREEKEGKAPRLGAAMDGTMIHIRGEGWKELKTGCVFEIGKGKVRDEETQEWLEVGRAVNNSYVGHLGGPEGFGWLLWAEARRRGWAKVAETEVIGDGAPWIWGLVDEHFYTSEQVVDWYHAKEHLAAAAALLYGEGTPGAQRWLKGEETVLYQGDAGKIARLLREGVDRHQEGKEGLLREAGYFEHNKRRMDYLEKRADGWVIGSGMVESGGKQYKTRFVGPGMHWSRRGAERLLPIRTEIMSDTFHQAWKSLYYSPPA